MDLVPMENLKTEKSTNSSAVEKELGEVARILGKYKLKNTLKTLVEEHNIPSIVVSKKVGYDETVFVLKGSTQGGNHSQCIDAIVAEKYCKGFSKIHSFIDCALDAYKQELSLLLLPILTRIFLKFMKINNEEGRDMALQICKKYHVDDGYFPGDTVSNLIKMANLEQVQLNCDKINLRMSLEVFKYFQTCFRTPGVISEIITKELAVQIYVGGANFNPKLHARNVRVINSKQICYGLNHPTVSHGDYNDTIEYEENVSRKRGRRRHPIFQNWEQNASPLDKVHGFSKYEGTSSSKAKCSRDKLPSVRCYTALNSKGSITCAEISGNGVMVAVGFSNSQIRIWALTSSKLPKIKSLDELNALNQDLPNVTSIIMDETSEDTDRYLYGHSGCVYRVNFSPGQNLLLSCSEDGTIRLWSLLTWRCIMVYKGHLSPVWDVRFSPQGHYFVSCSYDKTARLWATDTLTPFRIFAGHISDVDCVLMHPNTKYVGTGSTDCSVRIWGVSDGNCVRIMIGHTAAVYVLEFSNCGKYLASGALDGVIKIWEIRRGLLINNLNHHEGAIHSLCFSRDGNLLAASANDCRLTFWDFTQVIDDLVPDESGNPKQPHKFNSDDKKCEAKPFGYLLRSYPSKSTPFYSLMFTKENVLLAMGPFLPSHP